MLNAHKHTYIFYDKCTSHLTTLTRKYTRIRKSLLHLKLKLCCNYRKLDKKNLIQPQLKQKEFNSILFLFRCLLIIVEFMRTLLKKNEQ